MHTRLSGTARRWPPCLSAAAPASRRSRPDRARGTAAGGHRRRPPVAGTPAAPPRRDAPPSASAPAEHQPPATPPADAGRPAARRGTGRRRTRQQPARLPPPGSPPLVRFIQLAVPGAGRCVGHRPADVPVLHPDAGRAARRTACGCRTRNRRSLEDFKRLWATNFLDNLSIEVKDAPYDERRHRQAHHLQDGRAAAREDRRLHGQQEGRAVEDRREAQGREHHRSASTRSSIPALIRKVEGVVRGLLSEKGYQFAEVTHEIKPMPGGPKLVHLSFVMNEGPEGPASARSSSTGNKAVSDGELRKQMKANKQQLAVLLHHRARHLPGSEVRGRRREGQRALPQPGLHRGARRRARAEVPRRLARRQDALRAAEASRCRRAAATRSATSTFDGNKVVKSEGLRAAVQAERGRVLQREAHPQGPRAGPRAVRRRSATGSSPAFPDLKPRDLVDPNAPAEAEAGRRQ